MGKKETLPHYRTLGPWKKEGIIKGVKVGVMCAGAALGVVD